MSPTAMTAATPTRRRFIAILGGVAAVLVTDTRSALAAALRPVSTGDHPEPRPGINASRVLTTEQLSDHPDAISAYDGVRQIPQIADGIRCYCGCASIAGYYSLLTCYEEGGMAKDCEVCQGEGRLTYRLHTAGKTLAEIRQAIDARFGT